MKKAKPTIVKDTLQSLANAATRLAKKHGVYVGPATAELKHGKKTIAKVTSGIQKKRKYRSIFAPRRPRSYPGAPNYPTLSTEVILNDEQWKEFSKLKKNKIYTNHAMGTQVPGQEDIPFKERKHNWKFSVTSLATDKKSIEQAVRRVGVTPKFKRNNNIVRLLIENMLTHSAIHPLGVPKTHLLYVDPYILKPVKRRILKGIQNEVLTYLLEYRYILKKGRKYILNKQKSPITWALTRRHRQNNELLLEIQARLPELESLSSKLMSHWGGEDTVYRFYHQSFKIYYAQSSTEEALKIFQDIAKALGVELNKSFLKIMEEGTGKNFEHSHNAEWLKHTRPMLEAFFHAREMVNMAAKYGKELKTAPNMLPSGWATVLYLFNLR